MSKYTVSYIKEEKRSDKNSLKAEKRYKRAQLRKFESEIIKEVRSRLCLYAKDDPTYRSRSTRDAAWQEISDIFGKSVISCRSKWNSLRDSFRYYYRSQFNGSDPGNMLSVKWPHYEALLFLEPYLEVSQDDLGKFSQVDCSRSDSISDLHDTAAMPEANDDFEKLDNSLERVLDAIENITTPKKPIENFFASIADDVDNLPKWRQFDFQIKVLQILKDHCEQNL